MMLFLNTGLGANAESWEAVSPGNVPASGTFFGVQDSAPYPYLPHPEWELPLYRVTTSNSTFFVFDDRVVNYSGFQSVMSALTPPGAEEGGGSEPSGGYVPPAYDYGEGDFWIELLGLDNQTNSATLGLHNVHSGSYGQILSRTNIEAQAWKPGPIHQNSDGTNFMVFDSVPTYGLSRQFYRGIEGFPVVSIFRSIGHPEAMEPTATNSPPEAVGIFNIYLSDAVDTNLTVFYQISGTAINDVDYTNLVGRVTIPANATQSPIFIHPRYDTLLEFDEPVTLTLSLTNGYLVDPNAASATIWIKDNISTNLFQTVVTNLNAPNGIDYHQPSNSLILSVNAPDGGPNNFLRVYTNGGATIVTNWSGIAAEPDEIKLATVKQTLNGFTNGDLYFGSDNKIGWLSATATRSNLNWCVLTNEVVANAQHLRGGLYVDQTGTFSNQLIAVTSADVYDSSILKGVWRVDALGQPVLLAEIPTAHLEGVITLTNDPARWGPWAGKVITGDESTQRLFAVAPNGVVNTFELGISPEDFDVIQTNQDLYCLNFHTDGESSVLRLSREVLANYVGDLMITEAGEFGFAALFIVSWNGTTFDTRRIELSGGLNSRFEHVTFAPLVLPAINP